VENGRTHEESGSSKLPDAHRRATARRAKRALAAIASAVLGLLLAPPGCLNPRPEEDPSFGGNGDFAPEPPHSQSCDANSSLPSCQRPPTDVSDDNGVDDADEEEGSAGNAPGTPANPAAPPLVVDAGVALDGGADIDGTDAGIDP
jgi:hypothetical protein